MNGVVCCFVSEWNEEKYCIAKVMSDGFFYSHAMSNTMNKSYTLYTSTVQIILKSRLLIVGWETDEPSGVINII